MRTKGKIANVILFFCSFLAATAFAAENNTAIQPVPRDPQWVDRHRSFSDIAKKGGVEVLFLGDSITDYWRSDDKLKGGKAIWDAGATVPVASSAGRLNGLRTAAEGSLSSLELAARSWLTSFFAADLEACARFLDRAANEECPGARGSSPRSDPGYRGHRLPAGPDKNAADHLTEGVLFGNVRLRDGLQLRDRVTARLHLVGLAIDDNRHLSRRLRTRIGFIFVGVHNGCAGAAGIRCCNGQQLHPRFNYYRDPVAKAAEFQTAWRKPGCPRYNALTMVNKKARATVKC